MSFLESLSARFPAEVLQVTESYGMPTVVIQKECILDVLKFLYEDPSFECRFLTDLCGVHYPSLDTLSEELSSLVSENPTLFDAQAGSLSVVYHVHNLHKNLRLRLRILFPTTDLKVPSVTSLFSAADWMERETYDFFGIEFVGHSNLSRILNMDEMTYFPLRKEYALEDATRDDKTDAFFGRTQGNQ